MDSSIKKISFEDILVQKNAPNIFVFVKRFSRGFNQKACIFMNSLKFPVLHDNTFYRYSLRVTCFSVC